MAELILGLVVFFAGHSVSIFAEPWRDRMAARLGVWVWQGLYAVVALIGLLLIVAGYGTVHHDAALLYTPPFWVRQLTLLLMLPVFPLLIATYLPGRIRTAARHPMLLAVMLWALAHLVSNTTLPDLLLFGGFLLWAAVDRVSMNRRVQRPLHEVPPSRYNDGIAVVGGLLLYIAFLLGVHHWLIGVSPIP